MNFNLESQVRLQIRSSPFMHKGFDAYSLGFVKEKAAFWDFPLDKYVYFFYFQENVNKQHSISSFLYSIVLGWLISFQLGK